MSFVMAATSAWTYVGVTYAIAIGILGGYSGWIIHRGRKIGRELPREERRWL